MKSKALTYLLLAMVLVVWGIIFSRIFNPSNDDFSVLNTKNSQGKEDTLTTIIPYKLKLNYTDPFLGSTYEVKARVKAKPQPVKKADPFPIENLEYLGMIKNAKKKSTIAIVKWKGKEIYLVSGEKVENIKLTTIDIAFIEVQVEGTKYKVWK